MGPVTAKTYPGQEAIAVQARPAKRAKYEKGRGHGRPREPDKRGYVFGALWEQTGTCWTQNFSARSTINWIDFLCLVESQVPAEIEHIYAIQDNLNIHHSDEVLFFSLQFPRWEFVYQPTYAAYLNLIEPWWKILRIAGAPRPPVPDLAGGQSSSGGGDGILECPQASLCVGTQAAASASPPASTLSFRSLSQRA